MTDSDSFALPEYTMQQLIGSGQFGQVRLAENQTTGDKVAVKFICRQKTKPERIHQEISNHASLQHPNIVRLHEIIERASDVVLVMEFAPTGDLCDYIIQHASRVPPDEARRRFRQIVAGVRHCHECLVAHRDLKPENILLDADLNVKLADFGLSAMIRPGELMRTSCGSPNYAAPELLYRNCQYEGPDVDIWACGVILYALLCACLPFDAENYDALFKKIKRGIFTMPGYLSPEAQSLISSMLTVDRRVRTSIDKVESHAWLTQGAPLQQLYAVEHDRGMIPVSSLEAANEDHREKELQERIDALENENKGLRQQLEQTCNSAKASEARAVAAERKFDALLKVLSPRQAWLCSAIGYQGQRKGSYSTAVLPNRAAVPVQQKPRKIPTWPHPRKRPGHFGCR